MKAIRTSDISSGTFSTLRDVVLGVSACQDTLLSVRAQGACTEEKFPNWDFVVLLDRPVTCIR